MLGPVEVRRDGKPVSVPAGKTTEVLMYLALAAGKLVRTELLFEDVWGDEAASVGRNALQSKVSQLRKALGDPGLVVGSGAGYFLDIEADAVDALRVLRLADEASALRLSGDASACTQVCAQALALFRGEGLFGASDAEWLAPHRARLDAIRLQLIEHLLGARMDLGAAGELVSELEMLTAAHPLREGLWALLITALYRDGRQADALAAYRTVRERLAEELGLDPGPDLQKLEQQILDHDPGLDARAREPAPERPATGGGLPPISSLMIGRDRELSEIGARLATHRLVTVVGTAGVGKTRLAIEAARAAERPDGSWLVRLDNAPTAETVVETVADALRATGATEASLIERLRGADVLVVLDNCEHVVDAVADLIPTLLGAGPGVRILATSQLPLGVDGECVYGLEPLSIEDSLALFAQRAGEHGRQQLVPDGATGATLEAVCRSLDGLPLAIELAASAHEVALARRDRAAPRRPVQPARRPNQPPTGATAPALRRDRLELRPPLPRRPARTLGAGVLRRRRSADAAEQVLHALRVPDEAAVDVVSRLVDRSLVTFDTAGDGTVRYRLLDSVRTFAMDRLHEAGDANAALRAHASWIASAAAAAAAGAKGPEQSEHVAFARRERSNIDAALTWAGTHDPSLALAIADDLAWTWVVLGDALGAQRVRAALDAANAVATPERRVSALLGISWLEASAGDVERGRVAVAEAFELLQADADTYANARAQWYAAYVHSQRGEFDASLNLLRASRTAFHELGCEWEEAAGWVLAAHCEGAIGNTDAARDACAEASRRLERVRDPWLLVHTEAMLGGVAQGEQRFADACEHLAQAAMQAERSGFAATEAYHLANLGRAQHQSGELDTAADTLRRAIDVARATGDLRVTALARLRLGRVLIVHGDRDDGLATLRVARGLVPRRWRRRRRAPGRVPLRRGRRIPRARRSDRTPGVAAARRAGRRRC